MTNTIRLAFAALALLALSACESEKVDVLKSPCVGIEGNPCGPKRAPVGNYVDTQKLRQA